jgi:ketosteroid isomerase-like protein
VNGKKLAGEFLPFNTLEWDSTMKHVLSASGVILLVLGSLPSAAQEKKQKDPREEKLLAVRQTWYDAYYRGDTEELARIEEQDFLVIFHPGIRTRDEQLAGIRIREAEKKGFPKGTTNVSELLRVRFYGNTAIVTGRGWTKFPDQKDVPKERLAFTEVWVHRDGEWKVVHLHFHQLDRS